LLDVVPTAAYEELQRYVLEQLRSFPTSIRQDENILRTADRPNALGITLRMSDNERYARWWKQPALFVSILTFALCQTRCQVSVESKAPSCGAVRAHVHYAVALPKSKLP